MSLVDLVRTGNYATAQAAFDAITTPSVVVEDDQFYTWAGIGDIAGEDATQPILEALKANRQEAFIYQLGGKGIQLHLPKVQAMLLLFAQGGVPGCAALAAKGRSVIPLWQSAGLDEPTLTDVQSAFAAVQAELAKEAIRSRLDALYNQIGTNEEPLAIAELRAIANELEG